MTKTIEQHRARYAKIRHAFAHATRVNSRMFDVLIRSRFPSDCEPTAEDWVAEAERFECECGACMGTGIWAKGWDVSEPSNPRPINGRTCARCRGTGIVGTEDAFRYLAWTMHMINRAAT